MKHTTLFNVACRTMRKLTPEVEEKVYDDILNTINGDLLYGSAPSKEIILEAYFEQNQVPWQKITWVDLVDEILNHLGV